MRRLLALALVSLSFVALGCKETNPDYCGDAGKYQFSCKAADAAAHDVKPTSDAPDASDVADSSDVADATDAGEAGDAGDAHDAPPEAPKPICVVDDDCHADAGTPACATVDGGASCVECTQNAHCKGAKPVCDVTARRCVECTGAAANASVECKTDPKRVCLATAQSCVQCLDDSSCAGVTPKCEANACRACKSDAECAGPGVCLDSGACAATNQVIYVDFNAGGCPGATGATDKPFCSPSDAVAAVVSGKGSVIIIRGPASGPLGFDTAVAAGITVVGRKNAANEAPTIPLGVLTGIRVSAGGVSVRDLSILGGTAASAKGATVSGVGASLALRRVTIDSGTGLGVQADGGAALGMDQCIVKNNSVGGLLVNGASYAVTNSVFAGNGYGVKFNVPKTPSRFVSNTVVQNTGNAVTCDPSTPQTITGSIVVGFNDSCTPDHVVTVMPTFDAARAYHLTATLPCTGGDPTGAPDHDLDGDPRKASIDCGADQYVK